MFVNPGSYGPVALKDSLGRPVLGVVVTVPEGYTATVDGYHLTVTGPPADAVTVETTVAGQTRSFTVRVEPTVSELSTLASLDDITDALVVERVSEREHQKATYLSQAAGSPQPTQKPLAVDYDRLTLATIGSAKIVRYTERNRRRLVLVNTSATENLNVAQGTIDTTAVPGSGYTPVPPGQQWESFDVLPVFAYFAATAQNIRVYAELEA